MSQSQTFPIAAERLIPHRSPMCLIDRLLSFDGLQGVVEVTLRPEGIYLQENGVLIQAAMVEMVAQAFAAVKGYADRLEGKVVERGYLVGVKRFTFQGLAYENDRLLVTVTRTGETEEFALAEGRVSRGEELLAFGIVMVWVPREA